MTLSRLRDEILAKKPVIHTRLAEQFITEPQDVESVYNQHFHTHVPLGDTTDFANRLVGRVSSGRTSDGAVVAPWGYGKTSTLIFTWRACQDAGLVAVPPFRCSSLQDMLGATYGWLCFQLGSDWRAELESVYDQYGRVAFDERVRAYAGETGVPESDARALLQRALADGSFSPELAPSNLMKFLEYAAGLVRRAGFKGLVLLADELQDFFGRSADLRGTIQQLRDIVWWLAAHPDLALGVILCMPDTTEGMMQEDGQDILDRLKTDRLYIPLRNIYSPDFPRELWERYVELYDARSGAEAVLDSHALSAVGQIAAREDLGRGPRTVVDVFQCALRHFDKTKETYTAVALIDDFLTGQISFDMQTNPIRFAVEEALAVLKNQASTDLHRRAIKLWAAFPEHGCPDEVLEAYGAKEAAYELCEQHGIHGPLVTYQSVGYTLRKLATFTPGGTAVERIARDFWLAYNEQDPRWAEAAQAAFVLRVLPRIFERRPRAWGNWALTSTAGRACAGRLTGTFVEQYPARILDVQVALDPASIEPRLAGARSDFQFDFVLLSGGGPAAASDPGGIASVEDDARWFRFTLNLASRALAGANLPQDLRNLKSSIHPNLLTPQLMLAFVDYAARWEELRPGNHILESERGPVNAIVDSMINYSVRVLFSDEMKATFGGRLSFSGLQTIREVFALACKTAWPPDTYHPLLTASDRAFSEYVEALGKLSLREKRGEAPIGETQKARLASLFGIESHKTFENRAKTDYSDLMLYSDMGGDQAEVRLQLHPLEQAILEELGRSEDQRQVADRQVPTMRAERLVCLCSSLGYRDEEVGMVLRLLIARELLGKDDEEQLVYRLPAGPSPDQVHQGLQTLREQIHQLPMPLVPERERQPLLDRVEALADEFSPELEEEALEEMASEVRHVEADVALVVERKRQALLEDLSRQAQAVQGFVVGLSRTPELDEDLPAGLDFRRHLVDLQAMLRRACRNLRGAATTASAQVRMLHEGALAVDVATLPSFHQEYSRVQNELAQLTTQVERFESDRQGLREWVKLLKESDLLYASLTMMPDLRTALTDVTVRDIMRNFAQKGTDALVEDVEQFRSQFDEISRERNVRVAAGNEQFGTVKQRYRQWLSAMGVQRPDVPARYSPVEHELSYEDLYDQVKATAAAHLEELADRAKDLDLDLRKARRIHLQRLTEKERQVLKALEQRRAELQTQLDAARGWLGAVDLAQAADLDEYAASIASIAQSIAEVDEEIRRLILRPVPPATADEQAVVSLLGARREVDLTELVLTVGDDMDLDRLMASLIALYQGNQVGIKVQKRG